MQSKCWTKICTIRGQGPGGQMTILEFISTWWHCLFPSTDKCLYQRISQLMSRHWSVICWFKKQILFILKGRYMSREDKALPAEMHTTLPTSCDDSPGFFVSPQVWWPPAQRVRKQGDTSGSSGTRRAPLSEPDLAPKNVFLFTLSLVMKTKLFLQDFVTSLMFKHLNSQISNGGKTLLKYKMN